jgi:selenide,water dikinase
VLRHVAPFTDPAVLVDTSTVDDAAVYRIAPDRALVATVDFFTPIVDDPYDYGRIAATNALSDIYAMGARPLFALNLVGFPRKLLGEDTLGRILDGGSDVARTAGIPILGGHSVDDTEPKYGLCAIGEVHPDRIVRNSTARPGDVLILTKPIGTGIIATALKQDAAPADAVRAMVSSMTTLNRGASEAMLEVGIDAATDVTGFGLLGHLHSMLHASGVGARIDATSVPLLPAALELAARGFVPAGTTRNLTDIADDIAWAKSIDEPMRIVLCDAQTSGGLLIAVPAARADALIEALRKSETPVAERIGEVIEGAPGATEVR